MTEQSIKTKTAAFNKAMKTLKKALAKASGAPVDQLFVIGTSVGKEQRSAAGCGRATNARFATDLDRTKFTTFDVLAAKGALEQEFPRLMSLGNLNEIALEQGKSKKKGAR